jgi:hypothetical protein
VLGAYLILLITVGSDSKCFKHEWFGSGFLNIEIRIKESLVPFNFKNLKEQQQLVFTKEPVVFWAVI